MRHFFLPNNIFFLLLGALCLSSVFGQTPSLDSNQLKKRLERAQRGDYIVTETNKVVTVLAIRNRTESGIVFEEISAPLQQLKEKPKSWKKWVKNKAPGHTSWSMIEIDLSNHQLLECYSFSRAAWLQVATQESLLSTLLHLPMKKISEDQRKKIGPSPGPNEEDHRQLWNPPLIINGQKVEKTRFDAYSAEWPNDQSELSGKTVTLYFDQEEKFPLPYWIQVDASYGIASVRVIDSGSHLPSPYNKLPRRVPEFIGAPRLTEKGLQLSLKSPKYYKSFELFAIDVTTKEKHILPLPHFISARENETFHLEIQKNELSQTLEPGHRYTWLLVPTGYGEYYTESKKTFQWQPEF